MMVITNDGAKEIVPRTTAINRNLSGVVGSGDNALNATVSFPLADDHTVSYAPVRLSLRSKKNRIKNIYY